LIVQASIGVLTDDLGRPGEYMKALRIIAHLEKNSSVQQKTFERVNIWDIIPERIKLRCQIAA